MTAPEDKHACVGDLSALRGAYSHFLSPGRILLTGHSHQAWPDVSREAMLRYFDDAARFVDDKWPAAIMPKVERTAAAVLERIGLDPGGGLAFGKNTHELVFRLLTCLPLHSSPRIVTTTGEFHSLHRQLRRLEEEGVAVDWVDVHPHDSLPDRLLAAITPGTAMVAFSAVLFEDGYIVPRLGEIIAQAAARGAMVLVDAYHAFNVVPLDWGPAKDAVFVTAGGYKYAAIGEGLGWLRLPAGCALRPVYTGWYADFAGLAGARTEEVAYGTGGWRFAGATFDASALYRAEAVLAHWDRFGLTVDKLRAISTRQTRRIIAQLDASGLGSALASSRDDARRGGFVAVRVPHAGDVVERLRQRGVLVDARNDLLRLGPAPYLSDDELDEGIRRAIEEIRRA